MDKTQAAEAICRCTGNMIKEGLVARTWGNISHRLSDSHCIITPSGIPYQDLSPSSLVEISLKNLQPLGGGIPSSEKGLHQWVYQTFPMAQAVIHTHQTAISVLSVCGQDLPVESEKTQRVLGTSIPCCTYGKSGSPKLKKVLQKKLEEQPFETKAWILAHHGALIWGPSMEEAWQIALLLEKEAEIYIAKKAKEKSDGRAGDAQTRREYYLSCYKRGLL